MATKRSQGSNGWIGWAVAALAIGFFLGRATAPTSSGDAAVDASADEVAKRSAYQEKKVDLEPSPTKGPADAPVVIYEISDFQCPFCSRAAVTMDQVAAAYPEDVQVVFKHNALSFHKDARLAAIASMAAARQGHFWKYHDTLFANQKALKRDQLVGYAAELGLDMEKFKKDLDDPALGKKVDSDQAAAVALGATGTPAFYVNGSKLSGAKGLADFQTEIDKVLERAAKLQESGTSRGALARALTAQSQPDGGKVVKFLTDEYPAPKPKPRPEKKEDTTTVWKVAVDAETEHIKGPKHAPVTMVEFSDFECPFCSKVGPALDKVREEYGDKVRLVFKHTPLAFHKAAPLASEASLAAGAQGKFWEYHDLLFANQKALDRASLEGYAEQLDLKMKPFKKALDEGTYGPKVSEDMTLGEAVQARGTPNTFINGRKLTGAKSFEDFKTVIDEELKKSQKLLDSGVALADLYGTLIKKGKVFNPLDPTVKAIATDDGTASMGDENAAITIVEYSDFECPYCSRVGGPIKALIAKYPGKVRVLFKHYPLGFHKNAQKAAEASLAANAQGRFWDMHDIMFDNQKGLTEDKLHIYAEQIGLDMEAFKKDMASNKYAATVKANMAEGSRIGVRGTPSVFIEGRKYNPSGGYSVAGLEKVLAREFGLVVKK